MIPMFRALLDRINSKSEHSYCSERSAFAEPEDAEIYPDLTFKKIPASGDERSPFEKPRSAAEKPTQSCLIKGHSQMLYK